MFGPNVVVATAGHPILPELREKAYQYNFPVHIGKNCWIGAGVVIVPGVTIGAAVTALYTVCFRFGTQRERGVLKSYFAAFRDNFRQSTAAWLTLLLCIGTAVMYVKHWENFQRIARKEEIGLRSTIRGDKRVDK